MRQYSSSFFSSRSDTGRRSFISSLKASEFSALTGASLGMRSSRSHAARRPGMSSSSDGGRALPLMRERVLAQGGDGGGVHGSGARVCSGGAKSSPISAARSVGRWLNSVFLTAVTRCTGAGAHNGRPSGHTNTKHHPSPAYVAGNHTIPSQNTRNYRRVNNYLPLRAPYIYPPRKTTARRPLHTQKGQPQGLPIQTGCPCHKGRDESRPYIGYELATSASRRR